MKTKLLIAVLAGFTFTACTNTAPSVPAQKTVVNSYENASEAKKDAFKIKQRKVGLSTKRDPNYHSPMSEIKAKNKKVWFNNQMYRLWDRQITKNQYIAESVSEFPNHKYEFRFIANGF